MDQKQQHENNVSMAKKIQKLSLRIEVLDTELKREMRISKRYAEALELQNARVDLLETQAVGLRAKNKPTPQVQALPGMTPLGLPEDK